MLNMVNHNGYFLMYASDELKDDYDIVKTAIDNDAFFFKICFKTFFGR